MRPRVPRSTDGAYQVGPARTGPASFGFPPPVGTRPVLADYPADEVITIPRHVPARSVQVLITADTFTEDTVFTSEDIDATGRARSTFTLTVQAASANGTRSGHLHGHDIYRVGAIASAEAALRLAARTTPAEPGTGGVYRAAEVLQPDTFLSTLQHRGLLTVSAS